MSFEEVPVACVEPSWLTKEFMPRAAEELGSPDCSVHLMPTDSHREAEFLCTRIGTCYYGKRKVKDLRLDANDPTLGWEALFGQPDTSPVINARSDCDLLIVRGGNYLPRWFLEQHLEHLSNVASCFQVHVLLPVSRSVGVAFVDRFAMLPVPSIKDSPDSVLREFIFYSIVSRVPDLRDVASTDRSSYRGELCELILAETPESRTRIEDALDFYAATLDSSRYTSVLDYAKTVSPKVAGKRYSEPADIQDRYCLRSRLESAIDRLLQLDRQFADCFGQGLLARTHEFVHPFDSSDPMHWFIGCISYLGCLFFDAGKKTGLSVVVDLDLDGCSGAIVRRDDDAFQRSLRVLRTFFQHSLNPEKPDDRKTLAAANDWFSERLGAGAEFSRHGGRYCVSSLLDGLSDTIDRLTRVIPMLQSANGMVKRQITLELARSARTMAEHEIGLAIQKVVKDQSIDVDWEHVRDKYVDRIVKEMKESTCDAANLDAMLLSICERYCYEMSRQPPNVGVLLKSAGLVDRQIGDCIQDLNKAWRANPRMTHEEYRNLARQRAIELVGALGNEGEWGARRN